MLRTIPKHKGTDHLQADIKGRIAELTDELISARRGAARTGPPTVVRPEGVAQIALLGPPNSGKSSLHHALTHSHAAAGPYPFTTQYPQPGMLLFEDVAFQLVDLPPVTAEHPVPWMANALQPADGAFLVVDLSDPACVEQVLRLLEMLRGRRVHLLPTWPRGLPPDLHDEEDPFAVRLPAALVAAKADLIADLAGELATFRELTGLTFPMLAASPCYRRRPRGLRPLALRRAGSGAGVHQGPPPPRRPQPPLHPAPGSWCRTSPSWSTRR